MTYFDIMKEYPRTKSFVEKFCKGSGIPLARARIIFEGTSGGGSDWYPVYVKFSDNPIRFNDKRAEIKLDFTYRTVNWAVSSLNGDVQMYGYCLNDDGETLGKMMRCLYQPGQQNLVACVGDEAPGSEE